MRIEIENGLYHVFARGIEKRSIFRISKDFQKFLDILKSAIPKFKISIYAYALLHNHYHLLLKTKEANLNAVMHYINTSYAVYFNYKYKRVGHLFQGRYKSILVEIDQYFLELTRYIHLQGVKKGIIKNPIEYKWTSYQSCVLGTKSFIDERWLFEYFSQNEEYARRDYRKFVEDKLENYNFEPSESAYKGMILGSPKYIEEIKMKIIAPKKISEEISYHQKIKEIYCKGKILEIIKKHFKITDADLKNRNRRLAIYQKIAIYFLKKYTGLKLTEISEICGGIHNVVVSRMYKKMTILRDRKEEKISKLITEIEKEMNSIGVMVNG
ncbi:MAG: transposase [candidate division WOR-3 bacterium]